MFLKKAEMVAPHSQNSLVLMPCLIIMLFCKGMNPLSSKDLSCIRITVCLYHECCARVGKKKLAIDGLDCSEGAKEPSCHLPLFCVSDILI